MTVADLDAVADELYALPPDGFTAARDERVAQARAAGDRDLAAAVGRLRRPTASAHLANRLVRERPGQVRELLELGAAMRAAQQQLAGPRLRELSGRRHELVSALARDAVRSAGHQVSADVERELTVTLEAALADPAAGEQLRAGRLTRALTYTGLGTAAPGPAATATTRTDLGEARTAVRAAQRDLARAERDLAAAEGAVRDLRADLQRLTDRVAAAERHLQDLRRARTDAAKAARAAQARLRRLTSP